MGVNPESLVSSPTSKRYTSFAQDINLVTEKGAPCRRIRFNAGSGVNLNVKYPDGSTDLLAGYNAGDQVDVQAGLILATSTTATDITVFW